MSHAAPAHAGWSLLPAPTDLRLAPSGSVTIADGARLAVTGLDREQSQKISAQFIELVASTRGLHLQAASPSDPHADITFEMDPRANVAADGGYRVEVGLQGIRVTARSPNGVFYGGVSVWQLLTPPGFTRATPAQIPTGAMDDHPRFPWRALLLDSGRHFQSVAEIERVIDWMSLHKLNVLLWHLTEDQGWRLEIPRYPELTKTGACRKAVGLDSELTGAPDTPYCGYYTAEDVHEIVRHAAARFVTIVPEIDLPGHSQAALAAYPWLGVTGQRPAVWTDWGISPWLLKPDPKTLQFVDEVLDEVMKLFPSRYISIGGDEADKQQWSASPELNARMRELGLKSMDELQGWFTNQVADHLIERGRTPVGWDDPLMAGVTLPASQVVMSWHSDHGQQIARKAAAEGHEVILAPTESLYFDYYQSDLPDEWQGQPPTTTLRQAYETRLAPAGATAAQLKRIIGVQGSLWTELVPRFANLQHALFPRIAALAEVAWSASSQHDWNGFLERLSAQLARYRALGIDYADSAFAPAFEVAADGGLLRVVLSDQAKFGAIRYTSDGTTPTSASPPYVQPLKFSGQDNVTLRAATFDSDGFELAAPRTQVLNASTLSTREGSRLESCSKRPGMRLDGLKTAGATPAYTVYVGDMCWQWKQAPLKGAQQVTVTAGWVPWRFGDEAKDAVVRPKIQAGGELEIHADSCAGPLLAGWPLAPAARGAGPRVFNATVSASKLTEAHDLCMFATGDPREGQWALARVEFSK